MSTRVSSVISSPRAAALAGASHAAVLAEIERAIHDVESRHSGEIRFVVETALDPPSCGAGVTPRASAPERCSATSASGTREANNGVLIYVLLADRDVEILADRGSPRACRRRSGKQSAAKSRHTTARAASLKARLPVSGASAGCSRGISPAAARTRTSCRTSRVLWVCETCGQAHSVLTVGSQTVAFT